jgi:ABC-type multidrug transport system fused ATPase/permease subunit
LQGDIEFKDVEFFYPTRPDTRVLNGLSCKFEKGKTTAIVGSSGSGKSTVVQLIERFYDATKGEILIDGKPLTKIKLRNLRRQIGYVS